MSLIIRSSDFFRRLVRGDGKQTPRLDGKYGRLLSRSDMLRHRCLPTGFDGRTLHVITDPAHVQATEELLTRYAAEPSFQEALGARSVVTWRVEAVAPETIDSLLQEHLGVSIRRSLQVDPKAARLLPSEDAVASRVLLCRLIGTQVVFAAETDDGRKMAEALLAQGELAGRIAREMFGADDFAARLRASVQMVAPGVIDQYFREIYGVDGAARRQFQTAAEQLSESAQQAAAATASARLDALPRNDIETLLTSILGGLKESGYSDLRISYDFDANVIDFSARQNGRYETIQRALLPNQIYARLTTWILQAANVTTPKTEPADGAITFRQVELPGSRTTEDILTRMSYVPLVDPRHREAACNGRFSFRIINDSARFMALSELGFDAREMAWLGDVVRARSGLVLLVGEMGSGKSVTANALLALKAQQEPGLDFVSLERPIEYRNPYLAQIELPPDGGARDRASPLRYLKSLVRQGTNGVFLGEIGEGEMARMVTTMALTGVYVVSTFHATNPFTALHRLAKEPFAVSPLDLAAMTTAIIHQCLVSEVCPTCAVPDPDWGARADQLDPTGRSRALIERYVAAQGWASSVEEAYAGATAAYGEVCWDTSPPALRAEATGQVERPTGDPEACRVYYRALGALLLPPTAFDEFVAQRAADGEPTVFAPRRGLGRLADGRPCPQCVGKGQKAGQRGRMAIPEIWRPTSEERLAMEAGLSPLALQATALRRGHRARFMAALDRLALGRLSVEHLLTQMGLPAETDLFPPEPPPEAASVSPGRERPDGEREGKESVDGIIDVNEENGVWQ